MHAASWEGMHSHAETHTKKTPKVILFSLHTCYGMGRHVLTCRNTHIGKGEAHDFITSQKTFPRDTTIMESEFMQLYMV